MVVGRWVVASRGVLGAVVDLNKPARYIRWGWFQMSVANFTVIVMMIAVFVIALVVPFPGRRRS